MAGGYKKPSKEDPSLMLSETEQGSRIIWSLGGYIEKDADRPKTPTQQQMDDWVFALKTENPNRDQISNNDYIEHAENRDKLRLPQILEDMRMSTINQLLEQQAESVKIRLDLNVFYDDEDNLTTEGQAFLRTMITMSTQEIAYYPILSTMLERGTRIGLGALFSFDTFGEVYQLIISNLYPGDESTNKQNRIALYTAVFDLLGRQEIINIFRWMPQDKKTTYRVTQIVEDTPYVTRAETHSYFGSNPALRSELGISRTNPEYNLFDKKYELALSGTDVRETVQPNMYLYDLYTSANIDEQGRRVDNAWQGDPSLSNILQEKYATSVTQAGNITQIQDLDDRSFSDYLDAFSKALECDLTEEQEIEIDGVVSRTLFPATDMNIVQDLNDKKRHFPMYIETSFSCDKQGPIAKIINDSNTSSVFLDYLSRAQGSNSTFYVQSDYQLMDDGRSLAPLGDKDLQVVSLFEAVEAALKSAVVSLTITERGLEPITGVMLSPQQIADVQNAFTSAESTIHENALSYVDYMTHLEVNNPSEALGYRLSKFDVETDRLVQEIIFANSGEVEQVNYVDTQVKYDKFYRYELSEFRLATSTDYQMIVLDVTEPSALAIDPIPDTLEPSMVLYDMETIETPHAEIIEIPIYGNFYLDEGFRSMIDTMSYPDVKVMDRPPAAPDLQVLPLLDNFREVKLVVHPNTGDYTGDHALPLINVPGLASKFEDLYNYQVQFENFDLPRDFLEFRNEGTDEIQKVYLLRSEELDFTVAEYNDLYASFFVSETGAVRILSTDPDAGEETVVSYDILDTLETNKYYYYSCYVEDFHGNPSLPSPIYRVRLVYEKGLFVPEIELLNYKPVSNKVPSRKFSRFMQIAASGIQTFPFNERNEENVLVGIKNLASQLGNTAVGNSFVFRLTSRDTGRKFDIKISFSEKTITPEDENTLGCE